MRAAPHAAVRTRISPPAGSSPRYNGSQRIAGAPAFAASAITCSHCPNPGCTVGTGFKRFSWRGGSYSHAFAPVGLGLDRAEESENQAATELGPLSALSRAA